MLTTNVFAHTYVPRARKILAKIILFYELYKFYSLAELKNIFFDVKTFRKYIVTPCRLFADKDDTYTKHIR